jgi:hypothetical protein
VCKPQKNRKKGLLRFMLLWVLWFGAEEEFLLLGFLQFVSKSKKTEKKGCWLWVLWFGAEEEFLFLGFLWFVSKPQKNRKKRVVEIYASLGFVIWCSSCASLPAQVTFPLYLEVSSEAACLHGVSRNGRILQCVRFMLWLIFW